MSVNLTIPAELIPDVREGLFSLLGDAAEAILHALEQPESQRRREWFAADREQLRCVFALLDLTGWDAAPEAGAVPVDLREHGGTLRHALDGYLPLLEDQEREADLNDRRRAAEGKAPRRAEIVSRAGACRAFMGLLEERLRATCN
jgi:hypothetical protein